MATRVPKEVRVERAREIIGAHPEYGKNRINKELREEFGTGLRRIFVGRLKGEVLYVKPTRVERRFQTLRKESFTPTEARMLSQNPISSLAMRLYREQRREMVKAGERTGRPVRARQLKELYRLEGHWREGKIQPLARYRSHVRGLELAPEAERAERRVLIALDQQDIYRMLRDAGFMAFEARSIAGAPSMPQAYHANPAMFEQAMEQRRRWLDWLLGMGWTRKQIRREIRLFYGRDPRRTPWDFVREMYKLAMRPKIKDFQLAMGRRRQVERAQRRTGKLYGKKQRARA